MNPVDRLEKLCVTLGNEIEILELENKIRQRVRQQVDKNQREYYLKEQLRAIQEELGNDQASEMRELRAKVEEKGLSEEALAKVTKEIDRLERMPQHSAEVVVLRNYLDWMLALPWSERTEDRLDMEFAQQVLDEDHYGLEKVKERIIEFLAVRQLKMLAAQREQHAGETDATDGAKSDGAKPMARRPMARRPTARRSMAQRSTARRSMARHDGANDQRRDAEGRRRAQCQRPQGADPLPDRPARRRQDLAGPFGRSRAGPQVRAHLAGRRA